MSSNKKKFELDRRSLLKNILVGTGIVSSTPFEMFLTNMMVNFLQAGTAHAAGVDPAFQDIKFISLILGGGLPRYHWDLPINPNGDDKIVSNPMVVNRFLNSSGKITAEHATTLINGYHMPYTWAANIPTTGGGFVPMSSLAQHMLTMRGIDTQLDSHPLGRYKQLAPVVGGISLSGIVADHATTPIPASGRSGGGMYYRSEKGVPYVEVSGADPLTSVLSPFSVSDKMITMNNGSVEAAIEGALKRMESLSMDKSKFLPSTFATRFNAKKLMMRSFGNLKERFDTLKQKYKGLIGRAFAASGNLSLVGIDDMQIPGQVPGEGTIANSRYRVTETDYFTGSDIRTLTDIETYIDNLADSMAIAEFMITQGLSSSVNVECGPIKLARYESTFNPATAVTRKNFQADSNTDAHFTGAHMGLLIYSRYYRAISACLYELIGQLKSVQVGNGFNLFDRTVMTVTSEFNRNPRTNGSGSEHGPKGSNYTVFSGMVEELMVVGNIKTNENNVGTWGVAGNIDELGKRPALIGNAASTVAMMLEVKSPTPNDQSFVHKENGKVKFSLKTLKNVA